MYARKLTHDHRGNPRPQMFKKKKKGKEKTNKLALSEIGTECQTQWSKWLLLTELASHPI